MTWNSGDKKKRSCLAKRILIVLVIQIFFFGFAYLAFSQENNITLENRNKPSDLHPKLRESAHKLYKAIENGEAIEKHFNDMMGLVDAIEAEGDEIENLFQEIEKRIPLSPKIIARHQKAVRTHHENLRLFKEIAGELRIGRDRNKSPLAIKQKTEELIQFIEKDQAKKVQLLEAENRLPWRVVEPGEILLLGDSSSIPQAGAPAAPTAPPTADELSPTIDVQITPEIQELANSLGNHPLNIFRYIYNNYDYTPYYGSMKGSLDTFWEKEGNDYDLASLLIALLRASNIPARYVKAKIIVPIETVMKWLDFSDPMAALYCLSSAKIPMGYYTRGGKISHVQIEHIYVEAYIPYANYRGTGEDDTGKFWIPLDPSFKPYKVTQEGVDIASQMGFEWKNFSNGYLGQLRNITPIEYYKNKIDEYVSQQYPGQSIDSLKRIIEISKMQFDFLPNTLPYNVAEVLERFSEIPQGLRHTLRFTIPGVLDYSTSLPEVSGRRITLAFDGATAEDQAVIDEYGSLFKTPPYLIQVKPILRIGGNKVAEGIAINCGISMALNILYTQPGETEAFDHNIITGSFNAVGITTGKVRPEYLNFEQVENSEESHMAKMLHNMAMKYHNEQNKTKQILNDSMKIKSKTFFTEALVSTKENISMVMGAIPVSFEIDGFMIDAKEILTSIQPVDGRDVKKTIDFMMVGGFEASYQENRVFEDTMFWFNGFSAIKGLQILKSMGVTIQELEPFQVYDNPYLYDVVIDDINNALNKGWRVIVPESTGGLPVTPYIKYDPNTGSAGYMIATSAGGVATFIRPYNGDLQLEGVLKEYLSQMTRHRDYGVATYAYNPESPYTVMMGDSFDLLLYFFIVVDGGFIGDRYAIMKIDTDKNNYSPGSAPLYALVPGEYTFKHYYKELFVMNDWGPMISPVMSDRYLGISTINNEDRIETPLSVYYTVKKYPKMTLGLVVLKVYQGTGVIRTIPINFGENLKAEWNGRNDGGQIVLPGNYEVEIESYATINGEVKEGISNRHKVTVFKVEIVEPADSRRFDITDTPTMPTINSTAQILGTTVEPNYSWEFRLSYPRYGLCSDLLRSGTGINWSPNFGSTIMGGDYQLKVNATISNISAKDDTRGIIRGLNPSRQNVRTAIGNDQTALRIACWESGLNGQFTDSGNPHEGPTRDFGIFQITVRSGATCADVWNWRENVRHALRILDDKRNDASTHHLSEHEYNSTLQQYILTHPTFVPPPLSRDRNYVNDQSPQDGISEYEREAIRRYNGGREHRWEFTNQQTGEGRWIVYPITIPANIGYVNGVLNSNCP